MMNTGFFKFLPALPLLLVCGRLLAAAGGPRVVVPQRRADLDMAAGKSRAAA